MRLIRLALGALALCFSAVAAALTTPDGLWSFSFLAPQQGPYPQYPAEPAFNGQRTVNASGLSMYDVPVSDFGLVTPTITRKAINDSGWVIGNIKGWDASFNTLWDFVFLTNGVDAQMLPDSFRMEARAIGNSGAALYGPGEIISGGYVFGVTPTPPAPFMDVPNVGRYLVNYWDTNDSGQYLVSLVLLDHPTDEDFRVQMAVMSPVPEPFGYALAFAALCVGMVCRRHITTTAR